MQFSPGSGERRFRGCNCDVRQLRLRQQSFPLRFGRLELHLFGEGLYSGVDVVMRHVARFLSLGGGGEHHFIDTLLGKGVADGVLGAGGTIAEVPQE